MSYEKAMKHSSNPRKGKPQYMGFSSTSRFTPSISYLKEHFWPYLEKCKKENIEPISCQIYYNNMLA